MCSATAVSTRLRSTPRSIGPYSSTSPSRGWRCSHESAADHGGPRRRVPRCPAQSWLRATHRGRAAPKLRSLRRRTRSSRTSDACGGLALGGASWAPGEAVSGAPTRLHSTIRPRACGGRPGQRGAAAQARGTASAAAPSSHVPRRASGHARRRRTCDRSGWGTAWRNLCDSFWLAGGNWAARVGGSSSHAGLYRAFFLDD